MQDVFDTMLARIRGHQLAAMIHLAARWELADRVGAGRTADALADELEADPAALRRLVRALAAFDIFSIDEAGYISQTEASRALMRDAPRSLHGAAVFWGMPAAWAAWGDLEYAVRQGVSSFEHLHKASLFDYLAEHPEYGAAFDSFMAKSPDDRHKAVVKAYDFGGFDTIADVGGGNGKLLATILGSTGRASGLLYDRAEVIADALPDILALKEAGRCTIVVGDFFANVPGGCDAYILSQIIHDWDDGAARRILSNCRAAMGKAATLILIERVLDLSPDRVHPNNFLSDMEMLVLHKAAERSTGEYELLLEESGFRLQRLVRTLLPFSVIEAVPV